MKQRKKYTEEFKQEAVALVTEQGYKVTDAAKSLEINDNNLRHRMNEFKQETPVDQPSENNREELKRLRKENRELRMEKTRRGQVHCIMFTEILFSLFLR